MSRAGELNGSSLMDILLHRFLRTFGKCHAAYAPILNRCIDVKPLSERNEALRPRSPFNHRGVHIGCSTIPGAGQGIFTRERIGSEQIICEYEGEVMTTLHLSFMANCRYVGCLSAFHCVRPFADDLGHFANHHFDPARINARFDRHPVSCRLFLTATRDIEPGEEIFVRYSKFHLYIQRWSADIGL